MNLKTARTLGRVWRAIVNVKGEDPEAIFWDLVEPFDDIIDEELDAIETGYFEDAPLSPWEADLGMINYLLPKREVATGFIKGVPINDELSFIINNAEVEISLRKTYDENQDGELYETGNTFGEVFATFPPDKYVLKALQKVFRMFDNIVPDEWLSSILKEGE